MATHKRELDGGSLWQQRKQMDRTRGGYYISLGAAMPVLLFFVFALFCALFVVMMAP